MAFALVSGSAQYGFDDALTSRNEIVTAEVDAKAGDLIVVVFVMWWTGFPGEERQGSLTGGSLEWNVSYLPGDPSRDIQQVAAWAIATDDEKFEITYSRYNGGENFVHEIYNNGWSVARFTYDGSLTLSASVTAVNDPPEEGWIYPTYWYTGEFSAPKDSLVLIVHTNYRADSAPVPAPTGFTTASQSSGQDSFSRLFYKIPDEPLEDEIIEGHFRVYDPGPPLEVYISDYQTTVLVFTDQPGVDADFKLSVPTGVPRITSGRPLGDVGVLIVGDSTTVGCGGASNTINRDLAGLNPFYLQGDGPYKSTHNPDFSVCVANSSSATYFDFAWSNVMEGPGPAFMFCKLLQDDLPPNTRVVALPCGDYNSGFGLDESGQWGEGNELYEATQSMVNAFLAQNPENTIAAVIMCVTANDRSLVTAATSQNRIEALIAGMRDGMFSQPIDAPIFFLMIPEESRQSGSPLTYNNMFIGLDAAIDNLVTVDNTGLPSEVGDALHLSGLSNIEYGRRIFSAYKTMTGI